MSNCRGYRLEDPIHVPGSRPGSNCPICDRLSIEPERMSMVRGV